jgi:hypothetical protein
MISVFQCSKCKSILGDTDLPALASHEGVYEVKHPDNVEVSRGRVKCKICGEHLGTEDSSGKMYFLYKLVNRYTVKSSIPTTDNNTIGNKKKRKPTSDDTDDFVSVQQFEELKAQFQKEMGDVKEAILSLFDKLDGR